jgi:hypothetical protein
MPQAMYIKPMWRSKKTNEQGMANTESHAHKTALHETVRNCRKITDAS